MVTSNSPEGAGFAILRLRNLASRFLGINWLVILKS